MNTPTKNNLIGLLLLTRRLQQNNHSFSCQNLIALAELKLPDVAVHYDNLVQSLLENGLAEGTADLFHLTPTGMDLLDKVSQEHSLHAMFYDSYYATVAHSNAHAVFCERVYGKDLCQHGMADMDQIGQMLAEFQASPGMKYLDFGCGDGRIPEYIADTTGLLVTGVDIAGQAIQLAQQRTEAKRERLRFFYADVEKGLGQFPPETFDRISAIDSLFFAQNQALVLRLLLEHLARDGIMAIFYICPPQLTAEETPCALALQELRAAFSAYDLTAQNAQHWALKRRTLLELTRSFREEGSEFLFRNRMAECNGNIGELHRFLYIVRHS